MQNDNAFIGRVPVERCDHSTLHQGSFTFPFSILARTWPWITRINVPVVAVPCVILVQPAYVYLCTYRRRVKLSTDVCVQHVYTRSLINIGSIFLRNDKKIIPRAPVLFDYSLAYRCSNMNHASFYRNANTTYMLNVY